MTINRVVFNIAIIWSIRNVDSNFWKQEINDKARHTFFNNLLITYNKFIHFV
jgi:hypothetical protein